MRFLTGFVITLALHAHLVQSQFGDDEEGGSPDPYDSYDDMMKGMGGMDGMGLPGMDGEEPDPEQLKEMLRALKDLKDSGALPESELVEVRKQFKEAFGSSIDDIMKGADEAGGELGTQDKELLDLMKDILE